MSVGFVSHNQSVQSANSSLCCAVLGSLGVIMARGEGSASALSASSALPSPGVSLLDGAGGEKM